MRRARSLSCKIIAVEYGHFEDYIALVNSTWKPTMEATKKAGIIIDYKVFQSTPPSPDQPDVFLGLLIKTWRLCGGHGR